MTSTTHTLLFRDSRDLSCIADGSVPCVVTSPPYPMIAMWDECFSSMSRATRNALARERGEVAFALMHAELDKVWAETHRVLRPGGFLCVNIGDAARTIGGSFRLYANHARVIESCTRLGFAALPPVFWWKPTNAPNKFMGSGMLPAGAYVTLEHEYILIFRKGEKRVFGSQAEKHHRSESALFWEERNVWFSDRWDIKGQRQAIGRRFPRERSGAFPFELAFRLVNMYSVKGDTILDPFLGIGTTTLAAIASARNSIGVEVDPSFMAMIEEQLGSCPEPLNGYIDGRLGRHRAFVNKRRAGGKAVKYRNAPHGFPVMTNQETRLKVDYIERVVRTEKGVWTAAYRDDGNGKRTQ